MHLFAAIVPPRSVLEEVVRAVDAVDAPEPVAVPRGLLRRWRGRDASSTTTAAHLRELDRPAVEHLYIPITSFGNVTEGDAVKLARELREQAATWRIPEVRFRGGAALEFPGDDSVWAKLDGELDELRAIGRAVPQVVQRLGFFVDRRQFRPWLSVGTITDESTAPYLERVVDALEALEGRPWTVDAVSLMRRPLEREVEAPFSEVERMPLAQ